MRFKPFFTITLLLILGSCKDQQTENQSTFLSPSAIIGGQLHSIDSTLFGIMVINTQNNQSDTSWFSRENIRSLTTDFTAIPDISQPKYVDRFIETSFVDADLNHVQITYTPQKPEKEFLQKLEYIVKSSGGIEKVNSIIANTVEEKKDTIIEKKLLWLVDKYFLTTTIKQYKTDEPDISSIKVDWSGAYHEE